MSKSSSSGLLQMLAMSFHEHQQISVIYNVINQQIKLYI